MSDEAITIKKGSLWKVGTFVFAMLFLASLFTGGFRGEKSANEITGNVVAPTNNPSPVQAPVKVSVDDDPVLGDKDAPVTIVEFSDYQCPFCSRFWGDALPQIKKDYVETGKAKIVFRDFPLSNIHPMAQKAAEAVECVRKVSGGKDEAYWKMHDKIFGNQASLSNDNLKAWAKELGYNIDKCLDSGEMTSEVNKDFSDGQSYGVLGTPAFFINGNLISGAQPYSVFQQEIEVALSA